MSKLINGVDYIVDYYAVLKVSRDASIEEIKKAYRKGMKENHPDSFNNASDEIKKMAAFRLEVYKDAKLALDSGKDDKKRYDNLLESFPDELISTTGVAIEIMGRSILDVTQLINNENLDEDYAELTSRLKALSQYDSNIVSKMKTLYEADKNDASIKKIYKGALNSELAFVQGLEDIEWQKAGVMFPSRPSQITSSDEYLLYRQKQMLDVKDGISTAVDKYSISLEANVAKPILISGSDEDNKSEFNSDDKIALVDRMMSNFNSHKEALVKASEKVVKVLDEIVELTEWNIVGSDERTCQDVLIAITLDCPVTMGSDEIHNKVLSLIFIDTTEAKFEFFEIETFVFNDKVSVDYFRKLVPGKEFDIVRMVYDNNFDLQIQINHVLNEYVNLPIIRRDNVEKGEK